VNVKAQHRVARARLGRLENALEIGPIARIGHATRHDIGIVEQYGIPANVVKLETVWHTRFIVEPESRDWALFLSVDCQWRHPYCRRPNHSMVPCGTLGTVESSSAAIVQ
jgi:hypothetical protein